ncbi:SpaA isopeptide-forming pilin-related protein [Actinosynnema sp. NPDC059335]|uniref:SpaA isopeptide-forming pilin-related protein n=1 Tax=Actinosynnema sp. NPDC059335 TaxID=3346804 RepID=UPI00366CD5E1
MRWRRLAGAVLATGLALLAVPGAAGAQPEVKQGFGHETDPQGYAGKPAGGDWLGSYIWRGRQVWCVQYSLLAPDSKVEYQEGDELLSKGGAKLPDDVAGNISYLLLRYANTQSPDESAALAHLLHSWTAYEDPAAGISLDPASDFRHIAYDEGFHYRQLARFGQAQQAVDRLRAEAEANRGPWAAKVTAPKEPQVIGTPGEWVVDITKTDGGQVAGAPVTVELADATLESGGASGELATPTDGKALSVKVVPTGPNPSVTVRLDSPADRPRVHVPADRDMQRIVTTGGEKKLTANATTTAKTPPGVVKVVKVDSETRKPLAGVTLKITGPDGSTPAKRQDDTDLTGPEGAPLVLQTGADGTAEVPDLRTPQEICVIEVAPIKGYEEFFDPNAPPKACGTVEPGKVLEPTLENKPDKPVVPITIHAGSEGSGVVARAAYTTEVSTGALVGFGGIVLIGATLLGLVVRRRATARS